MTSRIERDPMCSLNSGIKRPSYWKLVVVPVWLSSHADSVYFKQLLHCTANMCVLCWINFFRGSHFASLIHHLVDAAGLKITLYYLAITCVHSPHSQGSVSEQTVQSSIKFLLRATAIIGQLPSINFTLCTV